MIRFGTSLLSTTMAIVSLGVAGKSMAQSKTNAEPQATLTGHIAPVSGIAFASDEKTLTSVGRDGSIRTFDLAKKKEVSAIQIGFRRATNAVISRNGKMAAFANKSGDIEVWNLGKGQKSTTFNGQWGSSTGLAVSDDGSLLAAGGGKVIVVWDLTTGLEQTRLAQSGAFTLAFSADGKTLAASGSTHILGRGFVMSWNLGTRKELFQLVVKDSGAALSMMFAPNGTTLILEEYEGLVLRESQTGKKLDVFIKDGESGPCQFSPDGKLIAVSRMVYSDAAGFEGGFRIWNAESRREIASGLSHNGLVTCLAFSPDGKMLATGGEDKSIKLWNVQEK